MRKAALWTAAVVLALAGGLFAYNRTLAQGDRADCPGKIVCPITGEVICSDQCPLCAAKTKAGEAK